MSLGALPLDPGTTLGVLGGGQLGRMFVHAAQTLGFTTAVLDPDPTSPAGMVSHYHCATDYLDEQGLAQLMQRCAAITTEFENVPAGALTTLAAQRRVSPPASAVAIAQDRVREKAHFVACGVPCAPYAVLETEADLPQVSDALFPAILKTARLGYDGKGQVTVATRAELAAAWTRLKQVTAVLEKRMDLVLELSVIVARGADGDMVHFPIQRNLHRNGILAVTEVFAGNVDETVARQAITAGRAIAEELNYVGVLCIEFFLLSDGQLLVNEMAPRPHNSGHYSIDACRHSQFDLQVRTLAGLPLVEPGQHSPAIMLNLLGDLWVNGEQPGFVDVLALSGAHLHLYGKLSPRPGRKMGHLTLTGSSREGVRAAALQACALLGLAPF